MLKSQSGNKGEEGTNRKRDNTCMLKLSSNTRIAAEVKIKTIKCMA